MENVSECTGEDAPDVHIVLLLGPPGSGKTTLAKSLSCHFGYTHFDIGAYVRGYKPPEADLEDFATKAVERLLRIEKRVLLNGFPKFLSGVRLLKGCSWVTIDFVLVLQADDHVVRQRAAARHQSGERPEDDEAYFNKRLQTYYEQRFLIMNQLNGYCPSHLLDAELPKESVEANAIETWNRAGLGGNQKIGSRRDADEADIEVVVCLLSGEERLRLLLPVRSKIRALRQVLIDDGETEFDLTFIFRGEDLHDNYIISMLEGFKSGATIQMTRKEKPPPPQTPPPPRRSRDDFPVCFSADSLVNVLRDGGVDVQVAFAAVQVGDLVRTEAGNGSKHYRRVQRVWAHHWGRQILTFQLAQGCRLTPGHPILRSGQWVKPEDVSSGRETFEETVYQLEVEGHVDTLFVGGIVCALLGRYCGPYFGWNVFTRKTVKCDKQPCAKCAKAVLPGLSFDPAILPKRMLPPACFEPY
eukprot:TRINITY_DN15927_c0_g1_i1.p1 TRINITY_DN15927_c0_g1~~TRINITY_DN15927_c0_g1_i1.p1  ORF type:complete len:470 (-),score=88.94 TRINITY_DN15927_c0_g1_i1:57-1466(-)